MSSLEFNNLMRIFNFKYKLNLPLYLEEKDIFKLTKENNIVCYWGVAYDISDPQRTYLCYWSNAENFNVVSIATKTFDPSLFYIYLFPEYLQATCAIARYETGGAAFAFNNHKDTTPVESAAFRRYFTER